MANSDIFRLVEDGRLDFAQVASFFSLPLLCHCTENPFMEAFLSRSWQ